MARTQHREKANGAVKVRSISSGSTASVDTGEKLASQAKPKPVALKLKPTKANKQGVANAFEHYGQVIQAKVQPLPNQNQLGTGTAPKRWGKLKDDLKTLRSAGMKSKDLERGFYALY